MTSNYVNSDWYIVGRTAQYGQKKQFAIIFARFYIIYY